MPLLVAMTMRQGLPSANLSEDTKLGTVLDVLEGSAVTRRVVGRPEECADRALQTLESSADTTTESCICDRITPCTGTGWAWLAGEPFPEKSLGVLINNNFSMNKQHHIGLYKQQGSQQVKRTDGSLLFGTDEVTS